MIAIFFSVSTAAFAEVDPDCLEGSDSFLCASNRLGDATEIDKMLVPIAEKSGWSGDCISVLYTKGDSGGPSTIVVSINGPKGGRAPSCKAPEAGGLSQKEARSLERRGATANEWRQAHTDTAKKHARASAATDLVLRKIGEELKKALMQAPKPVRDRLLLKVRALHLGNGHGTERDFPLP